MQSVVLCIQMLALEHVVTKDQMSCCHLWESSNRLDMMRTDIRLTLYASGL